MTGLDYLDDFSDLFYTATCPTHVITYLKLHNYAYTALVLSVPAGKLFL